VKCEIISLIDYENIWNKLSSHALTVADPGIQPGSQWWKVSTLTAWPPMPPHNRYKMSKHETVLVQSESKSYLNVGIICFSSGTTVYIKKEFTARSWQGLPCFLDMAIKILYKWRMWQRVQHMKWDMLFNLLVAKMKTNDSFISSGYIQARYHNSYREKVCF